MTLRHWIIPIVLVLAFALLPARLTWCALTIAEFSRLMQFCNHSREENRWRRRAEYFESNDGIDALWWGRVIAWSTLVVLLLSVLAYC